VITVNPATRLPRNYSRFVSLIEQLFEYGRVPPSQTQTALLTLEHKALKQLIQDVQPSYVMAFSRIGKPFTFEEAISKLSNEKRPLLIVGGFPHGHFSRAPLNQVNETVGVDPDMLETWTVVSRVLYEYECLLSISKKRLKQRK